MPFVPSTELQNALIENALFVQSFSDPLSSATPHLAAATSQLTTLEGHTFTLSLSAAGYSVDQGQGQGQVFECLDTLLQSISAQYSQKRHEALFLKLQEYAHSQQEHKS